ncbi:MAG TPA: hypothetical protein VN950_01455 [Terriglobales bacterium]|nr:hypothetical protein [Terriglobales bacterium]
MRSKLIALLLTTLWIAAYAKAQDTQLAPRAAQAKLVVASVRPVEKSGAKILIEVNGRFISDGFNSVCIGEQPYSVDVHDANGRPAPPIERGREVNSKELVVPITSCISVNVKAGTTWKDRLVVSDLYNMGKPGNYLVQVTHGSVKSNTVRVTVVP